MVTLSSAFMSSRRARTMRSVSLALGRLEMGSGERRAARESAGVGRGPYPFSSLHSPGANRGLDQDSYFARFFPPLRLEPFMLFALWRLELFLVFVRLLPEVPAPRRKARSAVAKKVYSLHAPEVECIGKCLPRRKPGARPTRLMSSASRSPLPQRCTAQRAACLRSMPRRCRAIL